MGSIVVRAPRFCAVVCNVVLVRRSRLRAHCLVSEVAPLAKPVSLSPRSNKASSGAGAGAGAGAAASPSAGAGAADPSDVDDLLDQMLAEVDDAVGSSPPKPLHPRARSPPPPGSPGSAGSRSPPRSPKQASPPSSSTSLAGLSDLPPLAGAGRPRTTSIEEDEDDDDDLYDFSGVPAAPAPASAFSAGGKGKGGAGAKPPRPKSPPPQFVWGKRAQPYLSSLLEAATPDDVRARCMRVLCWCAVLCSGCMGHHIARAHPIPLLGCMTVPPQGDNDADAPLAPMGLDLYVALEEARGTQDESEQIRDKLVFDLVNETIEEVLPFGGEGPPPVYLKRANRNLRRAVRVPTRRQARQRVQERTAALLESAEAQRKVANQRAPAPGTEDPVLQARLAAERAAQAPQPNVPKLVRTEMRDAEEAWRDVERDLVSLMFETGDAMMDDLLEDTAEELRRVMRAKASRM